MEYWDLYDYKGKKKNKIAIRGAKLNNDDFHLVINAWILNDNGEFLITQRSANKSHPLMWECTGGSALIGESSLQAAIREVKEELGIDVSEKQATFIGESRRFYDSCPDILHVWLFKANENIDNIKIQKEEVNDVMWASKKQILQLFKDNKFEANSFFNKIVNTNSNEKMHYVGFNKNSSIDKLNDQEYIKFLKNNVPIIDMKWVDKKIDFDTAKKMMSSTRIIIQGKDVVRGHNTFYVDNEEKFNKFTSMCNNKYYLSRYIDHLPINVTIIIGKTNNVVMPTSVQLIRLEDDKFKYVGDDFIYSQKLSNKITEQINKYNTIIIDKIKKQDYKGIICINYIVDDKDNVYFMGISSNFQSSLILNKYLAKYCFTSLEELHYLAITDGYIGNTYLDKIDNSFVNCESIDDYSKFKYYKVIKKRDSFQNNTSLSKIFNYSILKNGCFQKRNIDK